MNQQTFLNELAAGLALLRPDDRRQVLDYYAEMILDRIEGGLTEEGAVARLEPPEQIAARIRVEYGGLCMAGPKTAQGPHGVLEYRPEGVVQAVELAARHTGLRLRPSPDGMLRVLLSAHQGQWVTADEYEGVYRLSYKPPLLGMLPPGCQQDIVLELPCGFEGTAGAKTSCAAICAEGLSLTGKLSLHTSHSAIKAKNCACSSFSLGTSNSSITLAGLTGQTCNATTSNSRIAAAGCHFAGRLHLTTSNGGVRVEGVASPDIALTTSNGAIKGWILGSEEDYSVSAHTSNARSSLPSIADAARPNRLYAATSNAKIRLGFAQAAPDKAG